MFFFLFKYSQFYKLITLFKNFFKKQKALNY